MTVVRFAVESPGADGVLDLAEVRNEWRERVEFELARSGGAARIVLEVDFKDGRPRSFGCGSGPLERIRLTRDRGSVP